MIGVSIVLHPDSVNEFLKREGLEEGYAPLEAVLLQTDGGTESGQPAVLLIATIDGKRVLIKTTLRLFNTVSRAIAARVGS